MAHAHLITSVRQLVATTFTELGTCDTEQFRETLLVCGGSYCGRRFQAEDGQAVWFFEENQVKFYAADGSLARVVQLDTVTQPTRIAA
jgi:hypothetical protein